MHNYLGSRRTFNSSSGSTGYEEKNSVVILVVKINKPSIMESGLWPMERNEMFRFSPNDWNHPRQLLFIGFRGCKLFLIATQLSSVSPGWMPDKIVKISLDSRRQEGLGFLLAWETWGFLRMSFVVVFPTVNRPRPSGAQGATSPWTGSGNLARSALWNLKDVKCGFPGSADSSLQPWKGQD